MASWTSAIYDHYHLPPSIKVEDSIVKYVFSCKRHGTTHTHAKKDSSMTNLKNHAERCDMKASSASSKQLKIMDIASQYNEGEFRLLHIYWLLNPQVKIHSDMMLDCDIKEVYEVSKERLKELLKEHEGRFHVTFDAWSAPNSHDYLSIMLVWCDKGQICVVMLDSVEGTHWSLPCREDNIDDESDIDEVEDDKDDLLDDEELAALDDIQKALEEEEDTVIEEGSWDHEEVLELTDEEVNTKVVALTKLLKLGKCIFHKSSLQKELANLCGNKKIVVLKMIRVIERGLHLRPALDALCIKSDHNKGKPPVKRLKHFRLTDVEWTVLQQLHPILVNFLKVTDRISQSGAPLLHEVIPMMDILTWELEKAVKNMMLLPCVHAGVSWGLAIIDKYYSKTDESIMWKMAMILHPHYKLDYFHSQKWLTEWVKTAEQSA
ncbi:hypothetical protein EV421DRAFT_1912525 [Armillaria borealis]|uniref:Uncharacterized protein n=1 Tax=Armillaria borealis TaxID=47425 RepID=A0AA39IUM3_9AGAR|nr:hypothetical protein EV421DRAFT_1912525 [Armillaria borealis]